MKKLVVGILAHVDSGKTTLCESILYKSGQLRKLGRVDHCDAFLDTHEIERERGITIFSKQALFSYANTDFTLLDTPGHIDFSAETERVLHTLDYAILVINGAEGIQNHTRTLWKLLERYNVPAFIFINKMDISHFTAKALILELQSKLGSECIDFSCNRRDNEFMESVAMCDDMLMNSFLEKGTVLERDIRNAVASRKIFPCFFGSALKTDGVTDFLECLDKYTKAPVVDERFGARVFKISEDAQGERLTHIKITGGTLKVKSLLSDNEGTRDAWSEKVNSIRIYSGAKYKITDIAYPGDVCAVTGLTKTYPGEGLGFEADADIPLLEPVLSYSVNLENTDVHTALTRLRKLEEEDPLLRIVWNERLGEIHAQVMGEIQIDVLKRVIAERFGMNVTFGDGKIAYKETIMAPVEGVGHYEPLKHYAEVHLLLEPIGRGEGIQFETDCPTDELDKNWQRLILTHLEEKDHIGVLTGSPITDMKITLIAGRAHQKHTEGGDFRQATYRALRQGLKCAQSILLEPWYEYTIEAPSENIGRVMTDLGQMGASFDAPDTDGDMSYISGRAPVCKMRGYHTELMGFTKGMGKLFTTVCGYEECHNAQEVIEEIAYDSDSDLENSADSIFCSHGAGFVVKWDKVRDYMHIDTNISFDEKEEEENKTVIQKKTKYEDGVAEDKELLRIFESIYGPVKQRSQEIIYTRKPIAQNTKLPKAKPLPKGPEYLLVDGYNIIFAWEELKALSKDNLDLARNMLINILCNYQGYKQCEVILVFDAYKVKGNVREVEKVNNISVVYTKEAETADMYIEKATHSLAKKHRVRVATSDNLEQIIILANGALRMSAEAFKKEIEEANKAIREFLN